MSLTAKQEKFAQGWFATGNKTEAYRRSYSFENMSESTINEKASRLASQDKIRARYNELVKASQARNETTVDLIDKMLKKAYAKADQDTKPSAMVGAAMGLAKLHGLEAPAKMDLSHKFSLTHIESEYIEPGND